MHILDFRLFLLRFYSYSSGFTIFLKRDMSEQHSSFNNISRLRKVLNI